MGSFKDLSQQKFTKLKVNSKITEKSNRYTVWNCICDCGNTINVKSGDLLSGHTKSCGCLCNRIKSNNPLWTGHMEISGKFFGDIKRSAIKRKITFDITIEYIWNLFIKQDKKCNLSKLPITLVESVRTASLDRIDSNIGYIDGNVQWLHKNVNKMKMDFDQKYFLDICQRIFIESSK